MRISDWSSDVCSSDLPKADARPLADSLIAALNRSAPEDWENGGNDWDDYYASWIKFAPQDAARIFGAQLGRWFRLNPEGHPFKRRYEDVGSAMPWLSELAKAAPLALLEQLLPLMRLSMKRGGTGAELPAQAGPRYWLPADRA